MATRFSEFVDKKTRQAKRELGIIKQILEKENIHFNMIGAGQEYKEVREKAERHEMNFQHVTYYGEHV